MFSFTALTPWSIGGVIVAGVFLLIIVWIAFQ